jgi:hypothetical protein
LFHKSGILSEKTQNNVSFANLLGGWRWIFTGLSEYLLPGKFRRIVADQQGL